MNIINFLKPKKEYSTLLVAYLILLILPYILRLIDPTAAAVDVGAISLIALAAVAVLTFQALTWMIIKIVWRVFGQYFELYFEKTFKCLTNWEKLKVALLVYFFYLAMFVLALASL